MTERRDDRRSRLKYGIWQLEVTLRDGSRSVAMEFHGSKEDADIWFDNQTKKWWPWREPKLLLV